MGAADSDVRRLPRELTEFVANSRYYLREEGDSVERRRDALIVQAFAYHYEHNAFYRDICNAAQITPDVNRESGVLCIPTLPIKLFKDTRAARLLTRGIDTIEVELRSSGTGGIPSVSRRDSETIDILGHILASTYREYFKMSSGVGVFLCPSPAEAPEIGMLKAFNFFSGVLDDRVFMVERYKFRAGDAIQQLRAWEGRFERHIFGPPFMVYRLLLALQARGERLPLDPGSKIITLGGWKRFTGAQITREQFAALCHDCLGVAPSQVRDMYGLVECNCLAVECEHNHKHVPPWIRMVARDPLTGEERPDGSQAGQIAILDPSCLAYPGFIETEDVGLVDPVGTCECGRRSQTMEMLRRIEGAEIGCCAVNFEREMQERECAV